MGDYHKLKLRQHAVLEEHETPEARYWRKFKSPVVQRLISPATCIDFCPTAPHDYAVTAGARIAIMDYASSTEKRAITKFKDVALSGTYRADGRLLVAGGMRAMVQVFDMSSRVVLRQFKGHDGPVHVTRFTSDNTHLFSAGDDCSLRYWDMASGEALATLHQAHNDYIRCGQAAAGTPTMIVTGSYDHLCRVWDTRLASSSGAGIGASSVATGGGGGSASMAVDGDNDSDDEDEAPEAAAAGAGSRAGSDAGEGAAGSDGGSDGGDHDGDGEDDDGEVADGELEGATSAEGEAAGGDGAATGARGAALRDSVSASSAAAPPSLPAGCVLSVDHGAPVTQVLLLPGGGTLLTAGGNVVKAWDLLGGGRLLHSFSNHQKLITAMALDGTATRLLTGGLDGLIKVYELAAFAVTHTMRCEAPLLSLAVSPDNARLVVGTTDSSLTVRQRLVRVAELVTERKSARLLRGGTYRYFLRGQSAAAAADDAVAGGGKRHRKPKLRAYDQLVRRFEYAGALDAALQAGDAAIVCGTMEDLLTRDGLRRALSGRDEEALAPLLSFVTRHVTDPRYARLLLDVADVLVSMYAPTLGASGTLDALFVRLSETLARELALGKELLALQGSLDMLMSAATTGSGEVR